MAFRSSTRGLSASGAGDVSINLPPGTVSGDIVLVTIYIESDVEVTSSEGFTLVADLPGSPTATQGRMLLFAKKYTGVEASFGFGFSTNTSHRELNAFSFSGRGDTVGAFSTASPTSGTALTAPSVTAGAGDDVVMIGVNFDYVSWTPPSGFTEVHDFAQNTAVAVLAAAPAGATGTKTMTASAGAPMKGVLLLLPSAAPPPPEPVVSGWQLGSIAC